MTLEPTDAIALAHCSKAWSDAMYLSELKDNNYEMQTSEIKEECNRTALAYSEKVSTFVALILSCSGLMPADCLHIWLLWPSMSLAVSSCRKPQLADLKSYMGLDARQQV